MLLYPHAFDTVHAYNVKQPSTFEEERYYH